MASAELVRKEDDSLNQFDRARREIRYKFAKAHHLLQEREAVLLAEVQELEDKFHGRGIADEIEKLFLSKGQLENTLKDNIVKEILQQSIAQIDEKISELKIQREKAKGMGNVDFEWNLELEFKLNTLGSIRINSEKKNSKLISKYKKKGVPLAVFGKHSTQISKNPGIFRNPMSITVDVDTNNFYICDYGNARVQVFDRMFQFLFIFSEKMNGPCGICILQEKVYVTEFASCSLNIYSLQGKLLSTVGKEGDGALEFKNPMSVAVSTEWRRIYICEFGNNRVQCLNLILSFNYFISDISYPMDVKLTPEEIVVLCLDNPCIRIYNNASHQLSRQMISRGEDSANQVWGPIRFLLDSDLNIIITDRSRHCVCIFSCTGALIRKFGKKGEEKGEFMEPTGITMDSEGRIVVVSQNPNHCIQLF